MHKLYASHSRVWIGHDGYQFIRISVLISKMKIVMHYLNEKPNTSFSLKTCCGLFLSLTYSYGCFDTHHDLFKLNMVELKKYCTINIPNSRFVFWADFLYWSTDFSNLCSKANNDSLNYHVVCIEHLSEVAGTTHFLRW